MSFDKVISIVAKSRSANRLREITGALLYDSGVFLQILEGSESEVLALYAKIFQDPRHEQVSVLLQEKIESRLFSDWSMGHAEMTLEDLNTIPGLNGFFTSGRTVYDMGHPELEAVVTAFRDGRLALA